jgi:hypothetical protein
MIMKSKVRHHGFALMMHRTGSVLGQDMTKEKVSNCGQPKPK